MVLLTFNVIALAIQTVSGGQAPPPPPPPPGAQLPIDENLWILLAVGIVFGLYVLYKRKRAINRAS